MAKTCPVCSGTLDMNGYCDNCNITLKTYRRILAASKLLYNEGLQKARARDLSGAVEILMRSIKFDKNNIDARNLLGLVYLELGETVLALRQWVVSKNLQPENNLASTYLKKIQDNQSNLDKLNNSIKKYNQALAYIQQGSSDLAVIQLKKILSMSPNFVKAYCLLALVYVKENQEDKAKKELIKALAIDKSNYIANKYYDELSDNAPEGIIVSHEDEVKRERKRARRQIVINQSVQQFLGVVFGLVVGAALFFFLYLPNEMDAKDAELESKQEQLDTARTEIEDLNATLGMNENQIKQLELDLRNAVVENDQLSNKDAKVQKLMLTMTTYLEGSLYESAGYLEGVNIADSTDGVLNSLYEQLVAIVFVEAAEKAYNEGKAAYDSQRYETGVEKLEVSVRYIGDMPLADNAHYFLGRCYQFSGETEKAIERFKYVLNNFPDSDKRGYATNILNSLGVALD